MGLEKWESLRRGWNWNRNNWTSDLLRVGTGPWTHSNPLTSPDLWELLRSGPAMAALDRVMELKFKSEDEEEVLSDLFDWGLPRAFATPRHTQKIQGTETSPQTWRMKERVRIRPSLKNPRPPTGRLTRIYIRFRFSHFWFDISDENSERGLSDLSQCWSRPTWNH